MAGFSLHDTFDQFQMKTQFLEQVNIYRKIIDHVFGSTNIQVAHFHKSQSRNIGVTLITKHFLCKNIE